LRSNDDLDDIRTTRHHILDCYYHLYSRVR
jgi:hypothetical protein